MKSPLIRLGLTALIFLLAIAISTSRVSAADATNEWNAKVVGMMVVAPEGGKDSRAYCWKPGVTVSVMLSSVQGKIVKANQEDSKLDSFTDDKGTDLTAGPSSEDPFNKPGISFMSSSSDKGDSSMIFDVKASGQPAKGATSFAISGKVNLLVADSQKQFTAESVEMRNKTVFSLGDLSLTISDAGTNRNSWTAKDYKYVVTFSSPSNLESISGVEFFDAQGNKIEAVKRSWGGGLGGYMVQFDLKQMVDRAKIVATCWQDLKTVDVPISIKTSVGL